MFMFTKREEEEALSLNKLLLQKKKREIKYTYILIYLFVLYCSDWETILYRATIFDKKCIYHFKELASNTFSLLSLSLFSPHLNFSTRKLL